MMKQTLTHEEIQHAMKSFLKKGGTIQVLPSQKAIPSSSVDEEFIDFCTEFVELEKQHWNAEAQG